MRALVMSPSVVSLMRVGASGVALICRSWWAPKQSSAVIDPVAGSPSKSTYTVVALRVVTHTGSSSRLPAGELGSAFELPGAQPSTTCVVSCDVGSIVKPQSQEDE